MRPSVGLIGFAILFFVPAVFADSGSGSSAASTQSSSCAAARSSLEAKYSSLNGSQQYTTWAKANPDVAQRTAIATATLNNFWNRLSPSTLSLIKQYPAQVSYDTLAGALQPVIDSLNQNFVNCGAKGGYQTPNFWAGDTCNSSNSVMRGINNFLDTGQYAGQEVRKLHLAYEQSHVPGQPDSADLVLEIGTGYYSSVTENSGEKDENAGVNNSVALTIPLSAFLQQVPFSRAEVLAQNMTEKSQQNQVTYPADSTSVEVPASKHILKALNQGSDTYPLTQDEYVFAHLPSQCQVADRENIRPLDVSSPLTIIDALNGAPAQPGAPGVATGAQRQATPGGVVAPAGSTGQGPPAGQTPAR